VPDRSPFENILSDREACGGESADGVGGNSTEKTSNVDSVCGGSSKREQGREETGGEMLKFGEVSLRSP